MLVIIMMSILNVFGRESKPLWLAIEFAPWFIVDLQDKGGSFYESY